ncbi:MAG: hypothetical protein MJB14_12265 [Spirochaetes bacterium]|nr:hypothetical protein [Spirochaetota bacterium]
MFFDKLPTDNIFKFMTVVGMIILVGAFFTSIEVNKIAKLSYEVRRQYVNDVYQLEEENRKKLTLHEIEDIIDLIDLNYDITFDNLDGGLKVMEFFRNICVVAGSLMVLLGFYLWFLNEKPSIKQSNPEEKKK